MKTAISLPDELFRQGDAFAERHGASRSQVYANALAEYLARHRGEEITAKLNEVLANEPAGLEPAFAKVQAESIGREEW